MTKRNVADLGDCKKLVDGFVENTLKKGRTRIACRICIAQEGLRHDETDGVLEKSGQESIQDFTVLRFDVGCLDDTRDVLKDMGDNDYIHANYVSTPTFEGRFICGKALLDSTCVENWKMIVQERAEVILMLCNLTENGAKKCAEYFPTEEGHSETFDKYTIRTIKASKFCRYALSHLAYSYFWVKLPCQTTVNIRLTKLVVEENGNRIHSVDHYHWVD